MEATVVRKKSKAREGWGNAFAGMHKQRQVNQ